MDSTLSIAAFQKFSSIHMLVLRLAPLIATTLAVWVRRQSGEPP
jgi:hypothetical protein